MNVARDVYRGMRYLGCSKRDMLYMTPKEFYCLWTEYLDDNGLKKKDKVADIDDLP